jgi:hypothetical protein
MNSENKKINSSGRSALNAGKNIFKKTYKRETIWI